MQLLKLKPKIISKYWTIIFPKSFNHCSFLVCPCKDDSKSCAVRHEVTPNSLSECEKKQEACEKKRIPNETPIIFKSENPADAYLRTHKSVRSKAGELTNFLNTSKTSILKDLKKQTNAARLQDLDDIRKILCSVNKKMKLLTELDRKCAYKNMLKVYKLNDNVNQNMKASDNSIELIYKKLEREINEVIDETCDKIDCIMKIINSCKECKSPQSLENCIETKGAEAVKLLDEISDLAKSQINKLNGTKDDSINERSMISKQISKEYQRATHDLSEQLSEYIKRMENKKSFFKKIFKID